MIEGPIPLAQAATASGTGVGQVLLVLAALLVALGIGALVVFRLRKGLLGREDTANGDALTLHDLRQLHARGAMSDEEFQRAKQAMLGAASQRRQRGETPEH
ncbi:MAG: SHOCT domain-containing protein [Planctomycetes bacterium]|nr:SHOCT domain-containing protein [Planctomycetota bacterium]